MKWKWNVDDNDDAFISFCSLFDVIPNWSRTTMRERRRLTHVKCYLKCILARRHTSCMKSFLQNDWRYKITKQITSRDVVTQIWGRDIASCGIPLPLWGILRGFIIHRKQFYIKNMSLRAQRYRQCNNRAPSLLNSLWLEILFTKHRNSS